MNEMKAQAEKHVAEIERLLKKIRVQAKASLKGASFDCNWGYVGDLSQAVKTLRECAREVD